MSYVFITCLYSQSDIVEWSELSVDDENLAALFEQYEELSEIAENPREKNEDSLDEYSVVVVERA